MPAPKKTPRPKPRVIDVSPNAEKDDQLLVKPTKKMAHGGIMRGAGAATRGKKYTRSC